MKPIVALITLTFTMKAYSQEIFESNSDVGNPKLKGSTSFDQTNQEYHITGSGYNIWFDRDEFHYTYKTLKGDFILTANFRFKGAGVDPHRKIGWMVRGSLEDDAVHYTATVHGDGLTALQWRPSTGAQMRNPEDQVIAPKKGYEILQLERQGNTLTMRAAQPGEPLQKIGSYQAEGLSDDLLAGIFISSHNEDVVEEATVWNVRIDKPVEDEYDPEESGWIGSRMETINVFTGMRKVIFESEGRFEAPNWMPDGDRLLYNESGSLFTINLDGTNKQKLNTGIADRNNNDHGISFDGKTLAISHHREGLPDGGSTIYVLPIEGGEPKLVTEKTPSYWHGWAPNNKEVVYVARRDSDNYDIYKISIDGGEEIKLTDYTGSHADGPEYSPDGKFIYYNASPTGTMQLWRMKPDGSEKEQITFDQYNDWFPHISPDGKWIAFISFPTNIDPKSHPSYKRVMLRLMPASGGAPRTIAYLYGGQGTINVPSWSPDSQSIAFVSNTK